MKISLIPWEFIWLINWLVLLVFVILFIAKFINTKKFTWPNSIIFYISCLILVGVPLGLRLTNYRFELGTNSIETTQEEHSLVDLRNRNYVNAEYSHDEIYEASIRAVQSLSTYGQSWTITHISRNYREIGYIYVQVPVFTFVDELVIIVDPDLTFSDASVVISSNTTDRNRDFGENARHIKQFYRALETELAKIQ